MDEKNVVATVTVTDPKTGRKEIWLDGKLVKVIYPPKEYEGTW